MNIIAKTEFWGDNPNLSNEADHWLCEIVTSDGNVLALEAGHSENESFKQAMLSLEHSILFNSNNPNIGFNIRSKKEVEESLMNNLIKDFQEDLRTGL